jgi:acetolactate synthase-1/2/3 large subunit
MTTVFDALVAGLTRAGVRRAFVVASVHNLALLERLDAEGVTVTAARSELGAAYLADGFARVSGTPTLVVTSTGPGAGNAVGAFSVAAKDGAPVVHISTANDRRPAHALHDVPEQVEWMRAMGCDVHDVAHTGLASVLRALHQGTWPFGVVVPSEDRTLEGDRPTPEPGAGDGRDQMDAGSLAPWLDASNRMLWIGGGARGIGVARLVELAERSGAAVFTSVQGKDLFPERHPQFVACTLNDRDLAELGAAAEVCLALGSRLTELSCTGWVRPFPRRIVRVAYSDEVPAFAETETTVVRVDAGAAADLAIDAFRSGRATSSGFGVEAGAKAVAICASRDRTNLEHRYVDAIVSALRPGDTFVCDMTKLAFWTIGGMVVPDGVRYLYPGLLAMGFGLPAALGASLVAPGTHAVVLVGDGGLVSILSELDLAAGWPGRVTVVLSDDDGYHILRPNMNDEVGPIVCEFAGPRWEMLAAACGAGYAEAPDPDALAALLGEPHDGVRLVRVDARDIGLSWRRATRPVHT